MCPKKWLGLLGEKEPTGEEGMAPEKLSGTQARMSEDEVVINGKGKTRGTALLVCNIKKGLGKATENVNP